MLVFPSLTGTAAGVQCTMGPMSLEPSDDDPRLVFLRTGYSLSLQDPDKDYAQEHEHAMVFRNLNKASNDAQEIFVRAPSLDELATHPEPIGLSLVDNVYARRRVLPLSSQNNLSILHVLRNWYGSDATQYAVAQLGDQGGNEESVYGAFFLNVADVTPVVERCVARVKANLSAAAENAKVIKWVTLNPGSQRPLTGSFHPVWEKPSDYYPRGMYTPTYVGIASPETRFLLRALFDRHSVPRDLGAMLVFDYIIPACAFHVIDNYVRVCASPAE